MQAKIAKLTELVKMSCDFKKAAWISLLVLWASFAFSSALSEISFVAALAFWFLWKVREKNWKIQLPAPVVGFLAAFVVWCSLSILWSEAPPQSFRGFFKVTEQALIFLIVADVFRETAEISIWKRVFWIMLCVVLADALFQGIVGKDLIRGIAAQDSGAGIRLSASFKTYGLLGCYLGMTLPIVLMISLDAWKKKNSAHSIFFFLIFAAGAAVLFFTKSRGAFLAFIAGIFFLIVYFKQWRLLAAAGILFAALLFILPKSMVIHLDVERKEQSLVERYYLWDRAISVIKAKPITGTGINTYAVAHQKYDTTKSWRVKNYYAHNGYLQLAAETGLPGLGLFLAFLVVHLFRFRKGLTLVPAGLLASVFSFMILALIDTVLHSEQAAMTFWYLLGLASAYFLETPQQKL